LVLREIRIERKLVLLRLSWIRNLLSLRLLKELFDNLTNTDFRSMRIFLRTKIIIYDNLTKNNSRPMRIFLRTKIIIYDNLTKTIFRYVRIFLTTKEVILGKIFTNKNISS